MATIQTFALPEDVPDRPHNPDAGYKFPNRSFGKKTVVKRSFQHTWFSSGPFCTIIYIYNEPNECLLPHMSAHVRVKERFVFYKSGPGIYL